MYARLAHNYDLLGDSRNEFYQQCSTIAAMQHRFATASSAQSATWTLTPAQADRLAQVASDARTAIKGLCFRLRWSDIYEEGILSNQTRADEHMMSIDQKRFEDDQNPLQ